MLLAEVGDNDCDEGNEHLGWGRIPTKHIDTEFKTEVIDGQINSYDQDISRQLSPTVETRSGKSDIFLQPETGEQGYRKDNTKGGYMRSETELKVES